MLAKTVTAQPQTALVRAAERGDLIAVRRLLESGADPNAPASFSAFNAACGALFPDIVREMLKYRADVQARDSAGRTALNVLGFTAPMDREKFAAEVALILLDAGADVNAQDNIFGNTALHEALNPPVAKVLIQAGANVNARNKDGQTPLMLTLDEDITRVLLEGGAAPGVRDHQNKTALDLARELALTEKIAVLQTWKR